MLGPIHVKFNMSSMLIVQHFSGNSSQFNKDRRICLTGNF